jgi:PKD domain
VRAALTLVLSAGLLTAGACCVIVIQNEGSDGGNPFNNNPPPQGDSGLLVAPVAVCQVSPVDAGLGTLVTFDGSNSEPAPGDNAIVGWAWDFGDGAMASGSIATHTYVSPGLWVTTLTVTDDQGLTAQNSCQSVAVQP